MKKFIAVILVSLCLCSCSKKQDFENNSAYNKENVQELEEKSTEDDELRKVSMKQLKETSNRLSEEFNIDLVDDKTPIN